MAEAKGTDQMIRLEDFIALAAAGKTVNLTVDLKKEVVTQKVASAESSGGTGGKELYLLTADFSFSVNGEVKKISKIYASGAVGEPLNAAKQNKYIANARLSADYRRLRDVDIIFEEKYYPEF